MSSRILLVLTSTVLLARSPALCQVTTPSNQAVFSSQAVFVAGEERQETLSDSQPVPPEVATAILASMKQTSNRLRPADVQNLLGTAPLDQWFTGVPIPLGNEKETDLLVWGRQIWLTGADNTWYWIVRSRPGQPIVLLFAPGTNTLSVLRAKNNNHRVVQTFFNTAADDDVTEKIFRYQGGRYRLFKEKHQPLQ